MIRRLIISSFAALMFLSLFAVQETQAQQAFGASWGTAASTRDWNRFYHYPYVYYPQNFRANSYYQSADNLYYRYPAEMRIPVYNRKWHNYYPSERLYHRGHQFILDVF
ncbi:MAG: calmodulin-binding protein [Pirellulaceae bacterium]|nr:hypothetical protein [Planctomycetales bacterium]